eukprot:m51a1_g9302 putative nudix family protein (152) ;mRNA; r:65987-66681
MLVPCDAVAAVVLREVPGVGRCILMGRRLGISGSGFCQVPGGKVDAGETPEAAVARELAEETGLHALSATRVTAFQDALPEVGKLYTVTFFRVEVDKDEEAVNMEPTKCRGWEWLPVGSLPPELFASMRSFVGSPANTFGLRIAAPGNANN